MNSWSPWHGCHRISPGCLHCYMHRSDLRYDRNPDHVYKTGTFDLPRRHCRDGSFKLKPGPHDVFTCGSSDFFLEEADAWRMEAYQMMKERPDLRFFIITKRIERLYEVLPKDWGEGYDNVIIGCTVENQEMADQRLPFFLNAPIAHRNIICSPLLENLHLEPYLDADKIELVAAGGESGSKARICEFEWITNIREQCLEKQIAFHYHQTGTYLRKDKKLYHIPKREEYHQAKKSGLDWRSTHD